MTLRRPWPHPFALACFALITGCCHLASGDDDETYDPCEDKDEGETCELCPPDDEGCVETAVIKVCDAEGTCGGDATAHHH
jgi:hypothetical protein